MTAPVYPVPVGLYNDFAQEILVATKARSVCLGIVRGVRGDSISDRGTTASYALGLPVMLETLARDFTAGVFNHPSPYDALLREIHRTACAEASWLIVFEGAYGTHISRQGPPDFLASTFIPDFLNTSARGIRQALRLVIPVLS